MNNDQRICAEHLSRSALIYVRQSSPSQVRGNPESTRVQLGLCEKAVALGWRKPRVIDDDLGLSASGYVDRPGFQELLTRVAMREVGIILCLDASRLSRNSKDWAHLFELCSYFATLIADLEQVYDLGQPNDRLLMGIKGTVSEMELTVLRARLQSGTEAKAARGELKINLPIGYVYDACDKIVVDPDERVQRAVTTVFEQLDRCCSVRQLVMWYRDHALTLPVKHVGKHEKTRWELPSHTKIRNILRHPIYAGVYVWGRRFTFIDYVDGKLIKRVSEQRAIEDSKVCIHDHHPAYITWDRLLENRAKISENRPRWKMQENQGAIRDGLALLTGLLRCAQCGGRIYVAYKRQSALYYCDGGNEKGSRSCVSFGSKRIDQRVSAELCRALEPLAIKASVAAADLRQEQVSSQVESTRLQVEAAQYEADRAFDQFDLCDPKNRLVADTLEERLNEKLAELQNAKQNLADLDEIDGRLTDAQRRRLDELARDFPSVWQHEDADPKLKKRILRSAIHEILVKHDQENRCLEVTIHWKGGAHSRINFAKRVSPVGSKADPSLVELVRDMAAELSDAQITRILNMKKLQTPRGLRWTEERVAAFRKQHHIRAAKRQRGHDHLTMSESTKYLGVGYNGLLGLVRLGAVSRNQISEFAPWRVSRAELDSERVQSLVRVLKTTGRLPRGGSPKNQLMLFDDGC